MFTIKRAAELTGVPEPTLRAWERRYGLVTPSRSDGGYRLYSSSDLRRIAAMQSLIAAGWAPRQAAEQVVALQRPIVAGVPEGGFDATIEPFIQAAIDLDPAALDRILDDVFARAGFESLADAWLMPTLRRIGQRWVNGELRISAEHLAVQAIMRRLTAAFAAAGSNPTGPRVVMGLAAGSHHEIGILSFATAVRRRGLDVVYLGPDLPEADWVDAVLRRRADGLVLSVPLLVDAPEVDAVIAAVRDAAPQVWIGVGGTHQERIVQDAALLGHSIAAGANTVADALSAPSRGVRSA